jgi:hypothetical protein
MVVEPPVTRDAATEDDQAKIRHSGKVPGESKSDKSIDAEQKACLKLPF